MDHYMLKKSILGLAMPNQCCYMVTKLILGWIVGWISGKKTQTLMVPIYNTTALYDI